MARRFEGSSSEITVSNNSVMDLINNFTVVGWLKYASTAPSTAVGEQVVSKGSTSWEIQLTTSSGGTTTNLRFNKTGVAVMASIAWPSTSSIFHHFACTKTSDTSVAVFIDGTVNNLATGTALVTTANNLVLGSSSAGGEFLTGNIAEFAIYKVVLSTTEIKALANGASPGQIRPTQRVVYLPLWGVNNEGDFSGNKLIVSTKSAIATNHVWIEPYVKPKTYN